MRRRIRIFSSPVVSSTCSGSATAITVAVANTTNATRKVHEAPPTWVSAAPTGAATSIAATPAIEIRALAVTSVVSGGSTRGTAAERVTR